MRRIAEPSEDAPATSRDGVRTLMSRREIAPFFAFAAACYLVAPYLGLDSFNVDPRIAEVWPPGGVGFVLLTTDLVRRQARHLADARLHGRSSSSSRRALLWHDLAPALWMALVGVGQPCPDGLALPAAPEPHRVGAGEPARRRGAAVRRRRLLAAPGPARRLPHPGPQRLRHRGALVVGAAQHGVLLRRRRDLHGHLLRTVAAARCRPARGSTASASWSRPSSASTAATTTRRCRCPGC